jgi:tartrate-resistant acid phosphatase type 5
MQGLRSVRRFGLSGRLMALGVAVIAAAATAEEAPPVPVEAATVRPITFAVIGDFGLDIWKPKSNPSDPSRPHERRNPYQAQVADLVASWKPEFVISTGDNNYPKGEASTIDANVGKYYASFIGNYKGIHGTGGKENRFFPVLGNHDWDAPGEGCKPYLDYFTLPGNERYYEFVWGPVHFFMLDNDGREPDGARPGGRQHEWFIKAVEASTSPIQVAVAHHPPYSSGEHGPIKGADWDFEKHGVELMLAGHDHNYERIQQDGITYVVNGAGGGNLRRMNKQGRIEGSEAFYHKKHGAQRVEVAPVEGKPGTWELTSRFIDVAGAEVDTFSVTGTAR